MFKFSSHVRKPSSTVLSSSSACYVGSCTTVTCTPSKTLSFTHFLARKKEDQEYHHLSYKRDKGQTHFHFTVAKLKATNSYLFPEEKGNTFFNQQLSRLAKVWQQFLPHSGIPRVMQEYFQQGNN